MKKILLAIFLVGCGTDTVQEPAPIQNPPSNPPPIGGEKTSFQEVTQIHNAYCIQCHANSGFLRSEAALKGSSAKQRVQNGSMPPPNGRSMPDEVREKYLDFFSA